MAYTAANRRAKIHPAFYYQRDRHKINIIPGVTVTIQTVTVGISVGSIGTPAHAYIETVTVGIYAGVPYFPPKPTTVPAGMTSAPVLLSQQIMNTPTIVNGRPT